MQMKRQRDGCNQDTERETKTPFRQFVNDL